ncbi:MAG: ABC transporter substrate-binding protein [Hyphomicrobiales bacterium]|nr:ABC transporter substrate-binding protein [Hyphomicrobiales bacterium]
MLSNDAIRRRFSRREVIRLAGSVGLALPAMAALAAACGRSGPGAASARSSPTIEQGHPPARRGGTLRVALSGEPPSLDTQQTTDSIVVLVTAHMYETLFTWDAAYNPVLLLAESYEISDSGLLITLRLRQHVPFHNGEEMRAADVRASIERWGTLVGLGEGLLGATEQMVEVDPYTIEFRLRRPFGTFAVALARGLQGCTIYPKSVLDRSDKTRLAEYIGTGPYRFVEWQPDRFIRLERFEQYRSPPGAWNGYAGSKAQYLDRIEFIPVRNEASRIAGLQVGDYHYLETVSPDHYPTLASDLAVAVDVLPADSWLNLVLNLSSPRLADQRVRRAIQLALDHQPIMQAAYGDGFYELSPTLMPGAPVWYSAAGVDRYNQNRPDESRQLLREAAYNGTPLRFMTTKEIQQEYNGTLVIKQQLEAAGFTVDLQIYDGATLSDRRKSPELWEAYTAGASFRPDPIMRNLTCSATGWWCDAEKDRLLTDLQATADMAARLKLWEQVQERFYEDVPRLKIGDSRRLVARSPKLRDVGATELQPEFSNAWLDR